MIPSFSYDSAVEYIRSKVADFYGKQDDLINDYQDAQYLLQEAYKKGIYIMEATEFLSNTIQLIDEHRYLREQLSPLTDLLGIGTGLGVAPVIGISVIAIVAAGLLYAFFDTYTRNKTIKQLIVEGLLPPGSILAEPSFVNQIKGLFTSAGGLAIILIGGYLLYQQRGMK
jgi:hypothetical protein